jgi:hypothetical protein
MGRSSEGDTGTTVGEGVVNEIRKSAATGGLCQRGNITATSY